MRAMGVVVLDERPDHMLQVASSEDQKVIKAFIANSLDPSLGESIGPWGPVWGVHDPEALGLEDVIERTGELGVSVSDQETEPG